MYNFSSRRFNLRVCPVIVGSMMALSVASAVASQPEEFKKPETPQTLPQWSDVQSIITTTMKGRSATEILSRGIVSKTLTKLEKAGWKLSDRKAFEERFLKDSDFLVRQLQTKAGRQFTQRIGKQTGSYDRLDRLREMPYGPRRIRELIRGPDGYKLIEYMTTTKQGRNLGKQLSRGVNGKGFNKPTGKIYTIRRFVDELQRLHKAELARLQPASRKLPRGKR